MSFVIFHFSIFKRICWFVKWWHAAMEIKAPVRQMRSLAPLMEALSLKVNFGKFHMQIHFLHQQMQRKGTSGRVQ